MMLGIAGNVVRIRLTDCSLSSDCCELSELALGVSFKFAGSKDPFLMFLGEKMV